MINKPFSRRNFLTGTVAAAGGVVFRQSSIAETAKALAGQDVAALAKACKGTVALPGEPNYEKFVYGELWNRLIPKRGPAVVVRVANEDDVIAAIKFARENKLKVVVRGGGHNWCQPSLRSGGLLVDLTDLNKVISIDVENKKAIVQPIISNRDSQKVLNAKGLAFPSGHCPQVKLSGYLLGGGMSWNQGTWGYGLESVTAMEIVTAEGKLITASREENSDYFWAARGAGYGFFGVVTKFHLKLYPLPKAIHAATYYFALKDAQAVGKWLGENAHTLAPNIELSIFLLTAPPELKAQAAADAGKVCMVTATIFADSPEEAMAAVKPIDACPLMANILKKVPAEPITFEQLFDASGSMWPANMRSRVKAIFSDANTGDLMENLIQHITKAPSETSLILFAIFAGPNVPAPLPDAALSLSARNYGGPWTQWKTETEDEANTAWHDECLALMKPHILGYYIGETDPVAIPTEAPGAFSPNNWKRLADLRDQYDPDRVFFGYFDGLIDQKA